MKIKKSELRSMIREEISRSKKISLSEGFISKVLHKIMLNAVKKEIKKAGIEDFNMKKADEDIAELFSDFKNHLPKDSPYRDYF